MIGGIHPSRLRPRRAYHPRTRHMAAAGFWPDSNDAVEERNRVAHTMRSTVIKKLSVALLLIAVALEGQSRAWATALPVTGGGFIAYDENHSSLSLVAPGYLIDVGASVFTLPQNFDGSRLPATLFTNFSGFVDDGLGIVTTPDTIYHVATASGSNCFQAGSNCVFGSFSLTTPGIFL